MVAVQRESKEIKVKGLEIDEVFQEHFSNLNAFQEKLSKTGENLVSRKVLQMRLKAKNEFQKKRKGD